MLILSLSHTQVIGRVFFNLGVLKQKIVSDKNLKFPSLIKNAITKLQCFYCFPFIYNSRAFTYRAANILCHYKLIKFLQPSTEKISIKPAAIRLTIEGVRVTLLVQHCPAIWWDIRSLGSCSLQQH